MLQRKLYQGSHVPFLKFFDVQHEHPTRPDHHLRSDPPTVIALRSRLRLNSTVFNSPLHQRRMTASPDCVYCAATPETVEHVLLVCPHYDSSRTALFAALGFRPPDGDLIKICLSWAGTRSSKVENLRSMNVILLFPSRYYSAAP